MPNKAQARASIAELVEKFEHDKKVASYSEDDVCKNYILPLFDALGWHSKEHEVSSQENIVGKRADYGFYLDGIPKFYVEAKKATEADMSKHITQAISYSYMRGVTWAVLSNFRTLRVYSAEDDNTERRKRPFKIDIEDPSDYLKKFDALWLLSKEAMYQQLLDTEGQEAGIIRKRKPVISALYMQLVEWRSSLMTHMFSMESQRNAQTLREADNNIQRLFDRFIFIRTVEDRGIEEKILIQILHQNDIKQKGANLWGALKTKFNELDQTYNSNLFAPASLDRVAYINPDVLKRIIEGLYTHREEDFNYDFAKIKEDVLGTVYEQYLGYKGSVDASQALTDKQRQRKAQGIYYTPQYVVRYIVESTLGQWLKDGGELEKVRVVDPACGSGSFLIVAFDVLDEAYKQRYPHATKEQASEWRYHMLQHNLFGVDLDEQAVEVTRLNLMLRSAYQRRQIPTFNNIRVGNSLTSFDWDNFGGGFDVVIGNPPYVRQETLGASFKDHAQAHYRTYAGTADLYVYFIEKGYGLLKDGGRMGYIVPNKWLRANYGANLREFLRDKVQTLIDFGDLPVFKDATTYPLIVTLGKAKEPPSPALAPIEMGEGSQESQNSASESPFPHAVGIRDLGIGVEATEPPSLALVPVGSEPPSLTLVPVGSEPPSPALAPIEMGEGSQESQNSASESPFPHAVGIRDLGIGVKATTLLVLPAPNQTLESVLPPFYGVDRAKLDPKGWSLAQGGAQGLLDKLKARGVPLGEYVDGKIYRGILTGYNEAFVIDRTKRDELIRQDPQSADLIKPFLAGRDVKRYEQAQSDHYVIYIPSGWTKAQPPFSDNEPPSSALVPVGSEPPSPALVPVGSEPPSPALAPIEMGEGSQESQNSASESPFPHAVGIRDLGIGVSHTHKFVSRSSPRLWDALKPLAKQMRRDQTKAESHLWQYIRRNQVESARFRRQHTIDRFIIDFYCTELNLAIEVDGEIHQYTQLEDAIRQEYLESLGVHFLRFTNNQVLYETQLVLEAIQKKIIQLREQQNEPPSPALAPIEMGEGSQESPSSASESPFPHAVGIRDLGIGVTDPFAILASHYPAIAQHLLPFAQQAQKRSDKGDYWWELRPCAYLSEFEKPKIVYPNILKKPEFTLDLAGWYTNQKCFIISLPDKYLLGILNSKIGMFLFEQLLPRLRGGFFEPSAIFFTKFPIPRLDLNHPAQKAQHDHIVRLVEKMLALKSQHTHLQTTLDDKRHEVLADINTVDQQINTAVYELYGLTEDEIKLVE